MSDDHSSVALRSLAIDLDDRDRALALMPVSDDVARRLDRYAAMLLRTQAHTNLIADSTVPQLWTRHIADSLQLLPLASGAKTWVDFGAGAGFPGIVVACMLADTPGVTVHLVESRQKKAVFLRDVVTALGLPAQVHAERAENCGDSLACTADVVMARALASLTVLCGYAAPLIAKGAVGLFPKGQDVEAELTEASKYWNIEAELIPSLTNPEARIVRVAGLSKRGKKK